MENKLDILKREGVTFLVSSVGLLLIANIFVGNLAAYYALVLTGLFLWLRGIKDFFRTNAMNAKTAIIRTIAVLFYSFLAFLLQQYASRTPDFFYAHFLWGKIPVLSVLLLEITILWGVLKFYSSGKYETGGFSPNVEKGLAVIAYLTLFVAANVFLRFVYGLQFHTAFALDLTDINRFTSAQLLLFSSVLFGVFILFITGHTLIKVIQSFLPSFKKRMLMLALAALIWLPFQWFIHPGIHFISILTLAVFTFAILMDLYSDKPNNGHVWFIIWLVFFSSVASAALLHTIHNHASKAPITLTDGYRNTLKNYSDFAIITPKGKTLKKGLFSTWNKKEIQALNTPARLGKYTIKKHNIRKNIFFLAYPTLSITNGISLFSIFFIFSLMMLVIISLVNSFFNFLPDALKFHIRPRSSLQERIQIITISTIIVSFIIIGYASVYFFKQRTSVLENNNAIKEIEYIQHLINHSSRESKSPQWQKKYINPLGYKVSNITKEEAKEKFDVDYTWFKQNRKSIFLHSPAYSNKITGAVILSQKPSALYHISKISPDKNTPAQGILTHLINVYVFLFLIAYAIVVAMSSSITWPLKVLGERLKDIRLNRKNEELEWQDNDEIGQLISNYNSMLAKLHESAEMLAKTERDNAWREMAKQVAHEIKTPLTPMKLSIQYLKITAERHPENLQEMVQKVSNTLIEQIDNLSSIATEFSNFAKMPNARNEKLTLNDVVVSVHNLFRKRDDMNIQCYLPIDDIIVFADREQLIRILNNLIKNATQAIPIDRKGVITIRLTKKNDQAVISIEDNGIGIPEEMHSKIFEPNFTTKSSGTGLGLAMCRNMIEGFNGKIYFVSTPGKGTTFYVEIPMMRLEDNYKDKNMVILT